MAEISHAGTLSYETKEIRVQSISRGEATEPVDLHTPYIFISGSRYSRQTKDSILFQRFSDALLSMKTTESKLNPVRAHTTTGIIISFKTESPTVKMQFSVLDGENRGHKFAVYQDGIFKYEYAFSSTDGPELIFDIRSANQGHEVLYEVTMPNWSITALTGLFLEQGYELSKIEPQKKPVYIAY